MRFKQLSYQRINFDGHPLISPTNIFPNTGNIGQIISLEVISTKQIIFIGNSHLYWRPECCFVKLRQAYIMLHTITKIAENNIAFLMGGNSFYNDLIDFNTTPNEPAYQLLTTHKLDQNHVIELEKSYLFRIDDEKAGQQSHHINEAININKLIESVTELPCLESLYGKYQSKFSEHEAISSTSQWQGEPFYTTIGTWSGTLDYIFLVENGNSVDIVDLLKIPDPSELLPGIPNDVFGSDHVPLMATLEIK